MTVDPNTFRFRAESLAQVIGTAANRVVEPTVGAAGNNLRYRGFNVQDLAAEATFYETAYLILRGELPTRSELDSWTGRLRTMRGLPQPLKEVLERIPADAHPMDVMRTGVSFLGNIEPEGDFSREMETADRLLAVLPSILLYWYRFSHDGVRIDVLLAASTDLSRRAGRRLLADGCVRMNGKPIRVQSRTVRPGDVIDIRIFQFTLMEVGNWVDADQSTGRLIHVPNGIVFTNQVANYTEGFGFIWHEIPVLITFESDRHRARQIIESALEKCAPNVEREAGALIRTTARSYHIKIGALTPIVYLSVEDSGVLLTARFLVDARKQRNVSEAIWDAVLSGFDAEADVELAYPTVRTFFHGPVELARQPSEQL